MTWRKSKTKDKNKKGSEKLEEYLLTRSDMLKLQNLNKFLVKMDIYTTTLGGANFITSSIVMPVIKSMCKALKADDEDPFYIANLKEIMLKDFRARCAQNIDGKFLCKSSGLDPRFKNLKFLESKEERDKVFDELEMEARELPKKAEALETKSEPEEKKRKLGLDWDESDDDDEGDSIKAEVESYRKEAMLDRDRDALLWWRERKNTYPHLARLARKYFCVPATSTHAERVYSGLAITVTKLRMCMTGEHAHMQMFLQDKL